MKQSNIQSNVHATHFFNFHYFLFFCFVFLWHDSKQGNCNSKDCDLNSSISILVDMNCITHIASTLRNNSFLSATAVTDYCIMRINRYTHQILQGSHKCCSHTCLIQFFCITKINKFVDNLKANKSIIAK